MYSKAIFRPPIQAFAGLALTAGLLNAGSLGVATGYNLFAFNNINMTNDVEGSVAFGGVLTGAPTIGSEITSSTQPSLVGDGTNTTSNVLGSSNYINLNGGSAYLKGYSSSSPAHINFNGGGTYLSSDPISGGIKNSQSTFVSLASTLSGLTSNATMNGSGVINLIGNSCTECIVDLMASNLSNLTNIDINSVTQTLIINVAPSSGAATWGSGINLQINGSQQNNQTTAASTILFNFENATAVNIDSSFFGSVLAPNATVTGNGQGFQGEAIANNITGLGETHYESVFNGTVPNISGVPEPGTITLLGGALVVFGLYGLRRRAHRQSGKLTASNEAEPSIFSRQ